MSRYNLTFKGKKQNRLFTINEKSFYKFRKREAKFTSDFVLANELEQIWHNIWKTKGEHKIETARFIHK